MIYINKNIGFYSCSEKLTDNYVIGSSLSDYENGANVLLNDAQEAFHKSHSDASAEECFNLSYSDSNKLANAKSEKLNNLTTIENFCKHFFVNSDSVDAWNWDELRIIAKCDATSNVTIDGIVYESQSLKKSMQLLLLYRDNLNEAHEKMIEKINSCTTSEEVEKIEIKGFNQTTTSIVTVK